LALGVLAKVGVEGSNPFARSSFAMIENVLKMLGSEADGLSAGAARPFGAQRRTWSAALGRGRGRGRPGWRSGGRRCAVP